MLFFFSLALSLFFFLLRQHKQPITSYPFHVWIIYLHLTPLSHCPLIFSLVFPFSFCLSAPYPTSFFWYISYPTSAHPTHLSLASLKLAPNCSTWASTLISIKTKLISLWTGNCYFVTEVLHTFQTISSYGDNGFDLQYNTITSTLLNKI